MPVKECQTNGVKGFKWGDEGKCYTGPDAREKAEAQGRAIEASMVKFRHAPPVKISDPD